MKNKKTPYLYKLQEMLDNGEITRKGFIRLNNEHEKQLEKKRKYQKGEQIKTFEQLNNGDNFVFYAGKPLHKAFLFSMPYNLVLNFLMHNLLFFAIKKEKERWNK